LCDPDSRRRAPSFESLHFAKAKSAQALLSQNKLRALLILRAVREDVRTLWANRDPELLEIIYTIRKLEIKFGTRSEDGRRLNA